MTASVITYLLYDGKSICQKLTREAFENVSYVSPLQTALWVVSYKMLADITEFCLHLGC